VLIRYHRAAMEETPTLQRLVVVSNRLPVTLQRGPAGTEVQRSTGGLVAALDPAMRERGGVWVGWPGSREKLPPMDLPYRLEAVALSDNDVRRYYHGFCNRTLWPLFHSLPGRMQLDPRDWQTYEAVNRRFAAIAAEQLYDGDLTWIHDYHLVRCGIHLRRARPDARIAFFLHIPFPPFDLFRVLPRQRELLRGLLACDLVGFHSPGYVRNFLECVDRLLGERVDYATGRIEHGERTLRAAAFPLGIDYTAFEQRARAAAKGGERGGERIVLGVDRLDYTKGIPERILAFERLLELHKEHRERVVLLQLAVPSRSQVAEYAEQKRRIDELVGRVNGRFGTRSWSPIRYLYRTLTPERLAALYCDADVALVTPLRDGMNLVAKEYVACQVDEPGVLVLSVLTGAAETMEEALRVNPYDVDGVAETLHTALTLPREDRVARMRALQLRERRNDVYAWLRGFLAAATEPAGGIAPVSEADFERWLAPFLDALHVALFLDYDGTLAAIASHPSEAHLSEEAREAVARCAARDDIDVTVVSGRALADVRRMVGVDGVTYAGNHGLEIEGPRLPHFAHPDLPHFRARAAELARELAELSLPGAWVEEKGPSLTFHYRQAEAAVHPQIVERARACIAGAGFQPRSAHCAVEARPPIAWDKGHAALHVLRVRYGPAWSERLRAVYVGDDETDEDAFRALQGLGATFRVGPADRQTHAQRRLRDVKAVETLLRWLAGRPTA
jgi:trehalose 6-phosphate synthase/phosphatase